MTALSKHIYSLKSSVEFVENITFRITLLTYKNPQASLCHGRVQQNAYFHKNQNKQIIPSNTLIKKLKIKTPLLPNLYQGKIFAWLYNFLLEIWIKSFQKFYSHCYSSKHNRGKKPFNYYSQYQQNWYLWKMHGYNLDMNMTFCHNIPLLSKMLLLTVLLAFWLHIFPL